MTLSVNMLIKDEKSQELERILWLDRLNTFAYTININKETCKTKVRRVEEIVDGIEDKYIKIIENDTFIKVVNTDDITEKQAQIRDMAWEVIKYIYVEPDVYYNSKVRRKLILEASKKFEINERTIYKYLIRFWHGGMCKNALIPNYGNCGGIGKEKNCNDIKRGRPIIYNDFNDEGINVDDDIKRIFRVAISKYHYNSKQNSLTTTYELMKKEFFTEDFKIENGIKIPVLKKSSLIPTLGQFRYWFQKERNIKKEISSRKSSKRYQLQNRPLLGESTSEAYGPGSIFQIDATVGDVYLVSRYNRSWIIGRPIIYAIIDVFSRSICGISISLEGPSWTGAMMALANSSMDKVKYCQEYNIDISDDQWPIHYLPDSIIADRGEFEGKIAEGLIDGLHIKLEVTPSFRADWKGVVEQNFRITNLKIKPFIPGFINQDFKQRGAKDYRLDAKLDIHQFTQIIIKCALYHNNNHLLKNYSRDEMMISDDIECIPINLWNWGIANRSGRLRSYPEDIVKLNLMPRDTATVTEKGVRYKGMYYSCEVAIKERWFEKARNYGTWKVSICYDSRNMNTIYIKNENNREYEKCFLLEYQERYFYKTIEEIVHLQYMEKIDEKKVENKLAQGKIDLMAEIETIVKDAQRKSKTNTNESKRSRINGIRENRQIEKGLNRENESFELGGKTIGKGTNSISLVNKLDRNEEDNDAEVHNIGLLRKKQRERLDE